MRYLLQLLLALTVLAVIAWATWQGYLLLTQQGAGLPENMRSVLVISVVVVLVAAYLLTRAIQYHGDQHRRTQLGRERLVLYEKFLSVWELTANTLPATPEARLHLTIQEWEGQLMLVASDKVLRAYNDLQQTVRTKNVNAPATAQVFRKLVLAMREDIGNNTGFNTGREIERLQKATST